jgi:flap endonuclease-1
LDQLDLSHEQLQWLGILVGTDFNPDGIYGIGPKTALDLVKQYDSFDELMGDESVEWESDNDPEAILDFFQNPPVEDVDFEFESPDKDEIRNVLIEQHGFSEKRVNSGLEKLDTALESRQSGLDSFT